MEIIKRKLGGLLLVALLLGASGCLQAQVTIGSVNPPDKAKLLHLESSGGLGLPRVELVNTATLQPFIPLTDTEWVSNQQATKEAHTGLMVYNLKEDADFGKGVYVWDGEKWLKAGEEDSSRNRWFYMPAFNLPMEETGSATFDLYGEYERQFTRSLNTEYKASSSTATTIPSPKEGTLYEKNELDYAVVYYDSDVITVTGISDQGVMSYEVLDTDPGALSFMTVIFVIKE